ncbi:hypothetical protein [Candidatus Nitrospira bockiana]
MRSVSVVIMMCLAVLGGLAVEGRAGESARELSAKAQVECDRGRQSTDRRARLAYFERSQGLAEQAVKLDAGLAAAHFALFCSLGEQLRIDGESLSTSSVFGFRRVMRALDRTLELDPDHLDALSSKGTFLLRLPGLLGGDAAKGEAMLRRVIERAPAAVNARLTLARSYAERGNQEEAMTLAREALRLAEAEQRLDLLPEARATVEDLAARYGQRQVKR